MESEWTEVRHGIFRHANPNVPTHRCEESCEFIGRFPICPISKRTLLNVHNAPRQLNLRGSTADRTIYVCIHRLYEHPVREYMHRRALCEMRQRNYGGDSTTALRDMRRDYCARTESFFPWMWTEQPPIRVVERFIQQLRCIVRSKWVTHHRINLEDFILSLAYVAMEGVQYRGVTILPKQYQLLSIFPPRRFVRATCMQLILKQIRTNPHIRDMTRLYDMLDNPLTSVIPKDPHPSER